MPKQVKKKTSRRGCLLALLVIAASLIAQAPSQVDALFGVALPSVANPNNGDENVFGLSGLAGLATGTLLNMAVGGALQTGVDLVGGAVRETRKPRSNIGRRFIGEVKVEHRIQKAKAFAKEMAKLREKQSECESSLSSSQCSIASFPMYFPSEDACECVPAISLEMKFNSGDGTAFDEATFVTALSSALGVGYDRIKVLDADSEAKTAAVKLLPGPEESDDEEKVRAFDYYGSSSSLFEASEISRLRSFLAWQSLDGFGPFSYSVQSPAEMCVDFVQSQSEAQKEVVEDACGTTNDDDSCNILWGNEFENALGSSSSASAMAGKILDSVASALPEDLLKSPETYSKYEESLKRKLSESDHVLQSALAQSQSQQGDDRPLVAQGPTIDMAFEDGTNLRLSTGLVPFSTGECSDCKCASESGKKQAFVLWETM
jgi:hypothetical protein